MSEKLIIHMVALIGTLLVLLAWFSGYISGMRGWWWVAIGGVAIYASIFATLSKNSSH